MPPIKLENLLQTKGVISIHDATALGMSAPTVYAFINQAGLQRISKGIYARATDWLDEMWLLSLRTKRAVFSHESALLLHDLAEREPAAPTVTVPSGYNASRLRKDGIRVFYIQPQYINLGKITMPTPDGNTVPCYNLERTICDAVRSRNQLDKHTYISALQAYGQTPSKNLARLHEYSLALGISGIIASKMEVLL